MDIDRRNPEFGTLLFLKVRPTKKTEGKRYILYTHGFLESGKPVAFTQVAMITKCTKYSDNFTKLDNAMNILNQELKLPQDPFTVHTEANSY